MTYVALNSQILPKENALISPEDRGFRFGDGLFETIRITKGKPYLWQEHLARLADGLRLLQISLPIDNMLPLAQELIKKNAVSEGILRLAVSRGEGSRGYLPLAGKPTCYITAVSMPEIEHKTRNVIVSTYRRLSPSSLPNHIKHANGLNSILARLEAEQQNVDDALLLGERGHVSETSSANLFWEKDGKLYTPDLSTGCLNGIMRQRFMTLIPGIIEYEASLEECLTANAMVITNSAFYVLPVESVNGLHRFSSLPLYEKWQHMIEEDVLRSLGK